MNYLSDIQPTNDDASVITDKQTRQNNGTPDYRLNHYYQRGYADGYRRYGQISQQKKDNNYQYLSNTFIVLLIFFLFLAAVAYIYTIRNKASLYEGDCLLDITTSYMPGNCLDN